MFINSKLKLSDMFEEMMGFTSTPITLISEFVKEKKRLCKSRRFSLGFSWLRNDRAFFAMAAAVDLSAASGDPAVVSRAPTSVHFVCGRFLSMKKPVVIPSLVAAISSIWGLKEKISIQEEENGLNGVFVFLFKDKKEKT